MKKKFILLLLALTMTLGLGMNTYAEESDLPGPAPVGFRGVVDVPNADELRQQANNKAAELEQVYGIKIVFEESLTKDAYLERQLNDLSLLEESLKAVPAELYFSARARLTMNGKILTVNLFREDSFFNSFGPTEEGYYVPDTVTIHLNSETLCMYPSQFIKAFLHEYGHMLHRTLLDSAALEGRWTALNGGVEYTNEMWFTGSARDSGAFISDYASSSYGEDFAETFSYFAVVPGYVVQQDALNNPESPVILKMLLMREILSEAFSIVLPM